jgi:hypothetical protein
LGDGLGDTTGDDLSHLVEQGFFFSSDAKVNFYIINLYYTSSLRDVIIALLAVRTGLVRDFVASERVIWMLGCLRVRTGIVHVPFPDGRQSHDIFCFGSLPSRQNFNFPLLCREGDKKERTFSFGLHAKEGESWQGFFWVTRTYDLELYAKACMACAILHASLDYAFPS